MKSGRRAGLWRACGAAAAAAGVLLGTAGEARAGDGAVGAAVGVVALFAGADIAFAVHDLDAASHNVLLKDGWVYAETIVSVPQTLTFNTILIAANADGDELGDIATVVGVLPTAGVTALTTHGIWGLTEDHAPADAMAGVSVLVGTNFALSTAALGRAFGGRVFPRWLGVVEMVLAAPGTAVGAYESTFQRPQQGAWIGLTAWSGALMVHGLVSAIADGDNHDDIEPAPEAPPAPGLHKAARRSFLPASFAMAPTVMTDGVTRMPGVMATGTF